jgi:hypothetical protein
MTPLIAASETGHVEAMRVLIEKGALIEAATNVHKPSYTHACTHCPANAQSSLV